MMITMVAVVAVVMNTTNTGDGIGNTGATGMFAWGGLYDTSYSTYSPSLLPYVDPSRTSYVNNANNGSHT